MFSRINSVKIGVSDCGLPQQINIFMYYQFYLSFNTETAKDLIRNSSNLQVHVERECINLGDMRNGY